MNEKYPTYKSTGQNWMKQIPEHWETKRIKAVFSMRKEKNNPIITNNILSLTAKQGVVPYAEKEGAGGNKPKSDIRKYSIARENDLLVNCMNVVSGSAGVSRYFGAISPVYYALYPRNTANVWYYHNIFRLVTFQRSLIGLGKGILMHQSENGTLTSVRMRISMDYLGGVLLPVPPLEEQNKIVQYLNWQISKINKLIKAKKEQISLLIEQRQILIDDAVLRLCRKDEDPNSKQPYGLIYPNDWTVMKLNGYFKFIKGLGITKKDLIDEGIPVISYGQVHSKMNTGTEINDSLIRYVDDSYLKTSPNSLVREGDFIFADTSEDFEGVGNCVYVDRKETIFAGYHTLVARPKDGKTHRYLAYLFKSSFWRYQLRKSVNGVKVYSITQKILKNAFVIFPPEEEQEYVVNHLDEKCAHLEKTIDKINEEIQTIEELKKKLISDVVTGQIDVRDIEVPEFEYVEEIEDSSEEDEDTDDESADEEV